MRTVPTLRQIVVILVFAAAHAGCTNDTPMVKAGVVPEKQFIFEGVRIEEREGTDLAWVGTAERTAGDLANADANGIHIRHFSASPNGQAIDIYGPRGQLGFEDHKATLESVRIVTPREGVLTGGTAHYEGKAERVLIDGPLFFTSPGLNVIAQSGEMHLDDSSVDVAGPVNGRFESPAKPVTAAAKP